MVRVTRRRHLLDGTAWGLLAEGLAMPTGLITVVYLTRVLGTDGYGLYTLTIGLVMMVLGGIGSLLARASIKFISQTEDWEPVATSVLRLYVGTGVVAALVIALFAPAIATALGEEELTGLLRLFAWTLPIEGAAQGHVQILIARSEYRRRALTRAVYWGSRVILIVGLVQAGLGPRGALLGALGAAVASLVVARWAIRPRLFGTAAPIRPLLTFALPLFVSGTAFVLSRRLDLFALKLLGGSATEAGLYASAQTLAFMPGMLNTAFAPLLLSSMNQAYAAGRQTEAAAFGRDFMRAAFWLLPFAAMAAGAAAQVCEIAYGHDYVGAGQALRILVFAGVATTLSTTFSAIMIVTDRVRAVLATALVPLAVALACFPIFIPRWGIAGAAASTLAGSATGLIVGLAVVVRAWRVAPPRATVLRALIISIAAWLAARTWIQPDRMGVVFLLLSAVAIAAAFVLLGERAPTGALAFRSALRRVGDDDADKTSNPTGH
jgi:O-antigen/teichoic acid export membrane protein